MELVSGAMGSLIPKLRDLLKEEYKLESGVQDQVRSLELELENSHAALSKVSEVPPDQLDQVVKIWASEVRVGSYDMEDNLDNFLMHVEDSSNTPNDKDSLLNDLAEKMTRLFEKSSERHKIAGAIDSSVAKPAASLQSDDSRLTVMHTEATQMIGIDRSSADLVSMLSPNGDDESNKKIKIVSVVGVGGLGKTTLAKAVYDKLKPLFDYGAFVPVGRDPNLKKVFRDILIDLDKAKYGNLKFPVLDERQLINELHDLLRTKRYIVVIDDIWETQSLERIKLALVENNSGSRIITTTRKFEVAKAACEIYKPQPLSYEDSKSLFYTRLFGGKQKCENNHVDELSNTIVKNCGGVPLAIVTMASFLLGKSREQWVEVCNSPCFHGHKEDRHMENTMHILSLNYYDLPSHLKICLLYLSVFPEDCLIDKDSLIWKWIAEGFVEKKPGRGLFEVGEEYFQDLINRNMIQGVDSDVYGIMDGCRLHDMVLDLILSVSREENFVIVGTLSETYTRKIAQINKTLDLTHHPNMDLPQVRTFIVSGCDIGKWSLHPRLKLVRVLALVDYCKFMKGSNSLEDLGNLHQLRYLEIRDTWIRELPEEIGALKFLQTLDLKQTGILELPCSIGMLTQLVCLRAPGIRVPDGVIGKLRSLEELQIEPCDNDKSRRQFVKDLGNLLELRVLRTCITKMDDNMQTDLMQSLGNHQKMQHLILTNSIDSVNMNAWDAVVPSLHLRCLFLPYIRFPKLPQWIDTTHLPSLSHIDINVSVMDEQGLKKLGGLPELSYLRLVTWCTAMLTNITGSGCFQKLRSCMLPLSMVCIMVNEDSSASLTICDKSHDVALGTIKRDDSRVAHAAVMPNLQELQFMVYVKQLVRNNISCDDLGLELLPLLHNVKVDFWCYDAFVDDVEREEATLNRLIQVHPNRPALQFEASGKEYMKIKRPSDEDDSATEEEDEETQ